MVQTSKSVNQAIVTYCDAKDCTHNKNQQCTAGAVDVSFIDNLVQCYTYTEEPMSSEQVSLGAGAVSQCDVIDCTHNTGQRCVAAEISVSLVDSVAQCVTYTT